MDQSSLLSANYETQVHQRLIYKTHAAACSSSVDILATLWGATSTKCDIFLPALVGEKHHLNTQSQGLQGEVKEPHLN